jgi:hypothetical protein
MLIGLNLRYGNCSKKIATFFEDQTPIQVKNRWHSTLKQATCNTAGHTHHARQAGQVARMFRFAENSAQMDMSSPFPAAFNKAPSN